MLAQTTYTRWKSCLKHEWNPLTNLLTTSLLCVIVYFTLIPSDCKSQEARMVSTLSAWTPP